MTSGSSGVHGSGRDYVTVTRRRRAIGRIPYGRTTATKSTLPSTSSRDLESPRRPRRVAVSEIEARLRPESESAQVRIRCQVVVANDGGLGAGPKVAAYGTPRHHVRDRALRRSNWSTIRAAANISARDLRMIPTLSSCATELSDATCRCPRSAYLRVWWSDIADAERITPRVGVRVACSNRLVRERRARRPRSRAVALFRSV